MAVLSGARDVRVMCVWVDVSCCVTAVGARVAAECDRVQLTFLGRGSTKHFLLSIMPNRRDYAKSVIEPSNDLNRM